VTARDDIPQQQRVHRPQQVRAQAHLRIAAQQPVQGQDDRAEDDRFLQLQPERDPASEVPPSSAALHSAAVATGPDRMGPARPAR
jgi:hypothetical protein